jgi:hypothetical protein
MKWHTLAFPALVAAALVGCNQKSGTGGETGAVPGGAATDTSTAAPAPTPSATDTTAMPAPGADSMSKPSDTTNKTADSTAK